MTTKIETSIDVRDFNDCLELWDGLNPQTAEYEHSHPADIYRAMRFDGTVPGLARRFWELAIVLGYTMPTTVKLS